MEGKVTRVTFPTASFSLTRPLIEWINAEAKRRGVSKSVVVRDVLEDAKAEQEGRDAA